MEQLSRFDYAVVNKWGKIDVAVEEIKAIKREEFIPEKFRTDDYLLDQLYNTPHRNKKKRSEGECLRVEILKEKYPMLRKSMGSSEYLYQKKS